MPTGNLCQGLGACSKNSSGVHDVCSRPCSRSPQDGPHHGGHVSWEAVKNLPQDVQPRVSYMGQLLDKDVGPQGLGGNPSTTLNLFSNGSFQGSTRDLFSLLVSQSATHKCKQEVTQYILNKIQIRTAIVPQDSFDALYFHIKL
eukprot:g42052.t1